MKFGVGVLGATGFIGTPYRKEIRESPDDASIIALHGRRWELLEAAGKEDQAKLITDDWRQVVEHPEVNLVCGLHAGRMHHEAVMRCTRSASMSSARSRSPSTLDKPARCGGRFERRTSAIMFRSGRGTCPS